MTHPRCPACGGKSEPHPQAPGLFVCQSCAGMHDGKPDEGGTCFADPSRRMEKNEQYREDRLDRLGRRDQRPLKGGLGR